jgi:transmembrane sensor
MPPKRLSLKPFVLNEATLQLIFQKYLNNSCSPEELDLLLEAMSQDNGNEAGRKLIQQQLLQQIDEAYPHHPEEQQLLDQQFQQILNRIRPVPQRTIYWKRWLSAAAIILALGGGWYLWQRPQVNVPAVVTVSDIAPGTSGAVLTLGDGQQLALDSLQNGIVAIQGNAQVLLQKGTIRYNHTTAPTAAIAWNTISTPRAKQFKLTLPDGTQAWLNAASSVRYPTAFTQGTREVEITGEVYFEVAQNAVQPFRVKFAKGTVEVLGTHFNMNTYADEPVIKATLLEGRIRVNAQTALILSPGQQAQITTDGTLRKVEDINTDEEMAWMNGKIALSNASLDAILRQISRWYNVDIRIESQLPTTKFNGIINRNVNLSSMLGALEAYGIHCKLQGNVLVIL